MRPSPCMLPYLLIICWGFRVKRRRVEPELGTHRQTGNDPTHLSTAVPFQLFSRILGYLNFWSHHSQQAKTQVASAFGVFLFFYRTPYHSPVTSTFFFISLFFFPSPNLNSLHFTKEKIPSTLFPFPPRHPLSRDQIIRHPIEPGSRESLVCIFLAYGTRDHLWVPHGEERALWPPSKLATFPKL